jgi:hypothetical protein
MASFCDDDRKLYGFIKAGELLEKQGIRKLVPHHRSFCGILLYHTFLYTISFPSWVHVFFFYGATTPGGPGLPQYRGFTITLRHTTLSMTPPDE